MTLFTFRRTSGDRTVYLCRQCPYGDPLAETDRLPEARTFAGSAEYEVWLAGLEPHERAAFAGRRWTRTELMLTETSPGLAGMGGGG